MAPQEPSHGHSSVRPLSTRTSGSTVSASHLTLSTTPLFTDAGRNTTNFTATNQLFLANPQVRYWRFEAVFSFVTEISSSALNFVINQPPSNGSCSIFPLQGTTSTLFSISCPDWVDEDGVKDYALAGFAADPEEQIMLAFSSVSDFTVRLPAPNINQTQLNLLITVRDTLDCVTFINISAVVVKVDISSIIQLIDQLSNSTNILNGNPLVQLLSSGNQNTVAQLVTSLSQHFNQINRQDIDGALSSRYSSKSDLASHTHPCSDGVPVASISVSPLTSAPYPQVMCSMRLHSL